MISFLVQVMTTIHGQFDLIVSFLHPALNFKQVYIQKSILEISSEYIIIL